MWPWQTCSSKVESTYHQYDSHIPDLWCNYSTLPPYFVSTQSMEMFFVKIFQKLTLNSHLPTTFTPDLALRTNTRSTVGSFSTTPWLNCLGQCGRAPHCTWPVTAFKMRHEGERGTIRSHTVTQCFRDCQINARLSAAQSFNKAAKSARKCGFRPCWKVASRTAKAAGKCLRRSFCAENCRRNLLKPSLLAWTPLASTRGRWRYATQAGR